jgi:hypothetical protein
MDYYTDYISGTFLMAYLGIRFYSITFRTHLYLICLKKNNVIKSVNSVHFERIVNDV